MQLTSEEIERYAPYHMIVQPYHWFKMGFDDYQNCQTRHDLEGVPAQAYDRGAECAMRRARAAGR